MIHLEIADQDEARIEHIAGILLTERLATDINVMRNIERWSHSRKRVKKRDVHLITAKTKALLFSNIDERIRKEYPEDPPEIYSLPIVNMDWEQIKFLQRHLKRV